MCRSAIRSAAGSIGAIVFFLGGFESDNPRVFPGMYVFFVCVWGGNLPSQEDGIFLKNGSEEVCCFVFRYGLFLYLSTSIYDNCVVGLDFFWIAFNLRSFSSIELLHMVGFSQRKLARCDSHRPQIRPLVHFFCAKFFEVESVERYQDVMRFSIDCPLHSIYKIEKSQLKRSGYRSRSNHVRAVWVSVGILARITRCHVLRLFPFFEETS